MRNALLASSVLLAASALSFACVDTSEEDVDGSTGTAGATGDDGTSTGGTAASDQAPAEFDCGKLAPPENVVLGYFPTWTNNFDETVAGLDFDTLTHVAIAFANPVGDGGALVFQGDEASMISLIKTTHDKGAKALVSLAGASDSGTFRDHIGPDVVDGTVSDVAAFVDKYGLDGVDVDIEGSAVDSTYEPFITKLAAVLRPKGKILTAAVARASWDDITDKAMWCFDFLNVMSYDYAGTWSQKPAEHSSIAQARQDLSYWETRKYPKSRTVLGMPFYGYCWGGGCAHGYTHFEEIATKYPDQTGLDWITAGDAAAGTEVTISLNGTDTIQKKTAMAQAYGGVMVWELTLDSADHLLWKSLVAGRAAP